jgi:endonuclease YncB( thermonuclease family)
VRVWGIDAPELDQRPWGAKAKERLRQLARSRITVEKLDRDNYGRTVARIYHNREDLGLRLVREGYVAVYARYNNDHRYRDALQQAKRKRLGIWARRGQQQTPWEWRKERSSR